MGIFRQLEVDCNVDARFVDNGCFVPINEPARVAFATGDFSTCVVDKSYKQLPTRYRTVFGPSLAHTGVTFRLSAHNLRFAVYRCFHDKVGTQLLFHRQVEIFNLPFWREIERITKERVQLLSLDLLRFDEENRIRSGEPHPKRALRVRAFAELEETGCVAHAKSTYMCSDVKLNFKQGEWARPGLNRWGRIVCDLSTRASLRAPWLPGIIKDAMSDGYVVGCGRLDFVQSPDRNILRKHFSDMLTANKFIFFSDDSSLSLQTSEGPMFFNMDISACDSSQGPAVFQQLAHLIPDLFVNDMIALINQCKQSCSLGKKNRGVPAMKFKPVWYYEYSGTTLTTVLNNIANLSIGGQVLSNYTPRSKCDTITYIESVLAVCGWSCKLLMCECFEDLQFLKSSPCYTVDGVVDCVLNLGVILRTLGQCKDDLPGRGDLESRAFNFNRSIISGMVHCGNHSLLNLLRRKFPRYAEKYGCVGDAEKHLTWLVANYSGCDVGLSCDVSLCKRYRISPSEWSLFLTEMDIAGYGDVVSSTAASKILAIDYGI